MIFIIWRQKKIVSSTIFDASQIFLEKELHQVQLFASTYCVISEKNRTMIMLNEEEEISQTKKAAHDQYDNYY